MRTLYLVPILHMSVDMGSLAPSLDGMANAELGQEAWQKHKEAVSSFWDCIAQFLDTLDVKGFKIYQDGMVADGADGLRIIREGINHGSKNHEIIGKLLERGAVLLKTEDPARVKQEYSYIAKIAHAKSPREKEVWTLRYRLAQGELLRQRDDFIAKRIQETLAEGESGILFIGAYHNIASRLPDDIQVTQLKDVSKVREYHKTLASAKKYSPGLQRLASYLTSPVSNTSS